MSALERWNGGEREAFLELAAGLAPQAYTVASALVGNGPVAEDAVRSVLRDLFQAGPGAIAQDEGDILELVRAEALRVQNGGQRVAGGLARSERGYAGASLDAEAAYEAVLSLPGIEREVLTLAYAQALPVEAIGRRMGMDALEARGHLRLAMQHVRDAMSETAGTRTA